MEQILPEITEWNGVPYVGCAVTVYVGSDSYPGTIVWVSDQTLTYSFKSSRNGLEEKTVTIPRRFRVRRVSHKGAAGWDNSFTEHQKYVYYDESPGSTEGEEYSWRPKRKNYIRVGTPSKSSAAQPLGFGHRTYYRDPHF